MYSCKLAKNTLQACKEHLTCSRTLARICIVLVQTCKEYVLCFVYSREKFIFANLQRTLGVFVHSCGHMHCTRANLQRIRCVIVYSREKFILANSQRTLGICVHSCETMHCIRANLQSYPCKLAKNTWYLRALSRECALYSCKLAKNKLHFCEFSREYALCSRNTMHCKCECIVSRIIAS